MSGRDLAKYRDVDLVVDQVYQGGRSGNSSDDPLPHLLGVSNSGGFRHLGQRPKASTMKMLVLYSSMKDIDWPDSLNVESGIFTYFGDRRTPGELHETPRSGNEMLASLFNTRHEPGPIERFPPIFVFGNAGLYRDTRFYGLAVPGSATLTEDEDLVAIWRTTGSEHVRFQNYRARFSILAVPVIKRDWINDIQSGNAVSSPFVPKEWLDWLDRRVYHTLTAPQTRTTRSKAEQLPVGTDQLQIIHLVHSAFNAEPTAFESCAVEIARLLLPDIIDVDLTRPWRDGGRDAYGVYEIGEGFSSVKVEFSLEAKCFSLGTGVGVKHLSRLISRLRYRQFGILVTTSYLAEQAYKEIVEDGHPIIVIAAVDICNVLLNKLGGVAQIQSWLDEFKLEVKDTR